MGFDGGRRSFAPFSLKCFLFYSISSVVLPLCGGFLCMWVRDTLAGFCGRDGFEGVWPRKPLLSVVSVGFCRGDLAGIAWIRGG